MLNPVVGPQRLLAVARPSRDDNLRLIVCYYVDRGVCISILEAYEILLALRL